MSDAREQPAAQPPKKRMSRGTRLQANFRTDAWPEPGDRVLTLSTCFRGDNHQRYLVQGKLVAEAHAK